MKLTKCEQGHFYDGDKYPACPYCNTDLQTETAIVHTSEGSAPAQSASPDGPVAGWLVVLDGPARGRDLRLGVGRSFVGLDGAGAPVTLSPDAPLGARRPWWSTTTRPTPSRCCPAPPRNCATWPERPS